MDKSTVIKGVVAASGLDPSVVKGVLNQICDQIQMVHEINMVMQEALEANNIDDVRTLLLEQASITEKGSELVNNNSIIEELKNL